LESNLAPNSANEGNENLQLTSERAKSNVFPWELTLVGLFQLRNILVNRVVEIEATGRMLVKQPKSREDFGDRSDTVLTVSIDRSHAWPAFVVLLRTVVLGPQSSIGGGHLDGERRAVKQVFVDLLYLIRDGRES
jgi:hypothetical protein